MASDCMLYILMRNDLASLDQGKSDAQSSHATSDAHECYWTIKTNSETCSPQACEFLGQFEEWKASTGTFGAVCVLQAGIDQIRAIINTVKGLDCSAHGGLIHDPEYPLRDGKFTHKIPLDTSGWVFGSKADLVPLLGNLVLLKALTF